MTEDSSQMLWDQVARVRSLAQSRLGQLSKLDPADCQEVYLFKDDQFCGIRFLLGAFQGDWRIGESVLSLTRGGNQIDRIEMDDAREKRAA